MLTQKKTLVYLLIFLLTATATIGTLAPAKADTWTDITLPYTITEAGNYRVTSAYNGTGIALAVNASDVVVDGQNVLINMSRSEGDNGVRINPGSQNVLLQNIKVRNAFVGVQALTDNFTIANSTLTLNLAGIFANDSSHFDIINTNFALNLAVNLFTKNCSYFTVENCNILNGKVAGIIATYSNNFEFQNCKINNNPAGFLVNDSQSFAIMGCELKNNERIGFLAGNVADFSFQKNDVSNSTLGLMMAHSTSYEIINSNFTDNSFSVFNFNSTKMALSNLSVENGIFGSVFEYCNQFTVQGSAFHKNNISLIAEVSGNFTVSSTTVANASTGLVSFYSGNFTLDGFAVSNTTMSSQLEMTENVTIRNSAFTNNSFGLTTFGGNINVDNSCFVNNSIIGLYGPLNANGTITNSLFSGNGHDVDLTSGEDAGAIFVADSNCTITGNTFQSNYDAVIWGVSEEESENTVNFTRNIFQGNNNTLFIYYLLPNSYTNNQFYFYNNFVNDSSYIDLASLSAQYSGDNLPFNPDVFHFNVTAQEGSRIYTAGRMTGGNFWAYPNGTGPSQTAVDADHDGFADAPYEVIPNQEVYDNLPYSAGYLCSLTFPAGGAQTLVANQTSSAVTVNYSDAFGNITSGLTVTLSSNSTTAHFYSDAAATTPITTLTIPFGQSTASFYFKDTAAGTPTITASAQATVSATSTITTNPHADTIQYIVISPQTPIIAAGTTVNFTTTAYDQYGNSWLVDAEYTFQGQSFNGNLTGTVPGWYYIESSYEGKTSQTTLTVNPGSVARFVVLVPNSAAADAPFYVRVVAVDSLGNIATGFNGAVTLTVNGTATHTSMVDLQNGEWFNTLTVPEKGTYTLTASDQNGHTGKSVSFTVTDASENPTPTQTPAPTVTPTPTTVLATKDDGSTLNLQINGNITSTQISNLQISQNQTSRTFTVSFTVSGPSGTSGFSNMTIPKSQVPSGAAPIVYIDEQIAPNQGYSEDSQNFYVWYTTTFSVHNIQIEFVEQQQTTEQPILLYAAVIAVIVLALVAVLVLVRRKHK